MFKEICANASCQINLDDNIKTNKILQAENISPKLFTLALEDVGLRNLIRKTVETKEIPIGLRRKRRK